MRNINTNQVLFRQSKKNGSKAIKLLTSPEASRSISSSNMNHIYIKTKNLQNKTQSGKTLEGKTALFCYAL
jgi:hypothetical protein